MHVAPEEQLPTVSAAAVVQLLIDQGKEFPEKKEREVSLSDKAKIFAARERAGSKWGKDMQEIVAANLGLKPQQVAGTLAVRTRRTPTG